MIDVLLSAAAPVIEEALERMMQKPKAVMPFVVIEALGGEHFVQFAGSAEEPLLFSVPALDVLTPLRGPLPAVVRVALDTLIGQRMDVPLTATLRITTEADGKSGGPN